jgi:hypothetical protein
MAEPLTRTGIRICGARGHKDVRRALTRYARWLRANFEFPIRVPVYLYPHSFLVTGDGRECSASFFEPYDRRVEPYIRIATGDYSQLKRELGRDNALATYIVSLSHEVMHYQQWIAGRIVSERGVATQAVRMLRAYELTVDRP